MYINIILSHIVYGSFFQGKGIVSGSREDAVYPMTLPSRPRSRLQSQEDKDNVQPPPVFVEDKSNRDSFWF